MANPNDTELATCPPEWKHKQGMLTYDLERKEIERSKI
jgi:hypothetical protein